MQINQLSKNFTLEEMLANDHNFIQQVYNYQYLNLKILTVRVLQHARDKVNVPIIINSGFRNIYLNKIVGGVLNSQHCEGQAVDIKCSKMEELFNFIRLRLMYDQVIVYVDKNNQSIFIHVSYNERYNRRESLICKMVDSKKTYIKINSENLTYITW